MDYHTPLPVLLLVDDWSSKHSSFALQDQVVILPVKSINVGNIQIKNKMHLEHFWNRRLAVKNNTF